MTDPAAPGSDFPPAPPGQGAWHSLPAEDVARAFAVDASAGLSSGEAARRLARAGPNAIRERPPRPVLAALAAQFTDFMVIVLLVAAVVSGLVGDAGDTIAIFLIVILNGAIGFAQERRAERALQALRSLVPAVASVVRAGDVLRLPAAEIVPGDIVMVGAGDLVPADLRLVEAQEFRVDESALTGESLAQWKRSTALPERDLPLADRADMAFKGTLATHGRARGIAVATGMDTELGRIAALLDAGEPQETPLQRRLAVFGRRLGVAVLFICIGIFAAGLARGEPATLMFLTAVSLAVAAVPEALPAVVTICLALGARTMARRNALIRRLPAVETLGSVTTICSDKTGTLTRNRMEVRELHADGRSEEAWTTLATLPPWSDLLVAMALCNDAERNAEGHISGDPTEIALHEAARAAGFDKGELLRERPRVHELPFDSDRMRMTTVHGGPSPMAVCKGAPESVLPLCTQALTGAGRAPIAIAAWQAAAQDMAQRGLRVLAVAQRPMEGLPGAGDGLELERDLTLLGLVGLEDPPRDEARPAVRACLDAGITPVMITGDHPATAAAIARALGMDGQGAVVTGRELAAMNDATLAARCADIRVYARVDPAQKIRIVAALAARGEVVAMTGDGVNDAPALERADIGVAMGRSGTDVAREAASLVLLDDNFATIVAAVREGRRIYDNIRKFIRYAMACNAAEILTLLCAPFLGLPLPLLPVHILWINLVTDGLPGLALAAEPAERDVMARPPRAAKESIFAGGLWQHMVWVGVLMAAVTLGAQSFALHEGLAHWQTIVFTVLTWSQMGHVLAIRSSRESLFRQGLASNPLLAGAVLLTFALQLAIIYVPWLNGIFHTVPLGAMELAGCLVVSTAVFWAVEVEKWLVRRGWIYSGRR